MKKYVDANMLQEQLQRKGYEVAKTRYNEGYNDALLKFKSMLHSAQASDVAEVKHATWNESYRTKNAIVYECSACSRLQLGISTYCCHCGARMNGEREE